MSYFIVQTVRKTYLKYLVEADSEDEAYGLDGKYLGYLDGDTENAEIIGGPFETKDAALADIISYTEGGE